MRAGQKERAVQISRSLPRLFSWATNKALKSSNLEQFALATEAMDHMLKSHVSLIAQRPVAAV